MDTRHKGKIAALKIELRAAEKGYICSLPTMEGCRYDMVVDDGTRLHRVQCKYAGFDHRNAIVIGLVKQSCGLSATLGPVRLYTRHEVDVVAAYLPSVDRIVWLPPETWEGKRSIYLRLKPPGNHQRKGVLFAQDFMW